MANTGNNNNDAYFAQDILQSAKSTQPLVEAPLHRRYAVNWSDNTESDAQYAISEAKRYLRKSRAGFQKKRRTYTWLDWISEFIPLLGMLRNYQIRSWLIPDLIAGLSVAALVVPQGMSYAKIAGLPSVYGLYGAFVPVLCYAALGTSKHLAVGPVAVTSLILGSNLPNAIDAPIQADPNNPVNQRAQDLYNKAAIEIAFIAGVMYTLVGIFSLGWITNFLAHSVIAGFMTGASVIIGLGQVKSIFGYSSRPNPGNTPILKLPALQYPRHDPIQEQFKDLFGSTWLPYWKWREFIMGVSWIILLQGMKYVGSLNRRLIYVRAFGPLTVCILSIAISNIWNLKAAPHLIRVIGTVPKGLPGETISWWFPMEKFGKKFTIAIVVCLIDVLESISIAKALAYKNKYELKPTQELRGLGLANIVGSMFNCYTTTGSFSRSSVMDMVGSRTQLAGVVSGLCVMIVLLCLTPVFKNMPQNAQAAIIISAVSGLFNYEEFLFLWKVNKLDFIVFNAAFFGVIFCGVEIGLAIAIGTSIGIALLKNAFPRTAVLGQLPGTSVYRNIRMYPEANELDNILMLRIDAPLFFANVEHVKHMIRKYETKWIKTGRSLEFIVIDLSPVIDIDASAVHFLKDWIEAHKKAGRQPVFANPSRSVVRQLTNAGLPDILGREFICVRMADAVALCQELLIERGRTTTYVKKTDSDVASNSSGGAKEIELNTKEV